MEQAGTTSNRHRYIHWIVGFSILTLLFYSMTKLSSTTPSLKLHNNRSSCPEHDHLFVVIMASFPRANGATKNLIRTTIKSLLGQKYTNWELFVTGDNYEPDAEFRSFFQDIPKEKLFIHNLPTPGERLNLTGMKLWESGGVTAMNDAMERAERRYQCCRPNCKVYLTNLDDDDVWSPDHLTVLHSTFTRFPSVVFTWTKGYYCGAGGGPFPGQPAPQNIVNNWHTIFGGFILHSSWGWRMETFRGFRYRRQWDFPVGHKGSTIADADLFEVVRSYLLEKKLDYFHSNVATIEHLFERGARCSKSGELWYPN